ncbi:MAG: DUF1538 domain-containing protein [Acidobacteriota bacterium]
MAGDDTRPAARERQFRLGGYLREVGMRQVSLSYNDLAPTPRLDADGQPLPHEPGRLRLRGLDVYRLVAPYVQVRLVEQLRAVIPLAVYLVLFQVFVLQQPVQDAMVIVVGLAAVIFGLLFFMEGLSVGLMPFAETLGRKLPAKSSLPVVLLIACTLGVGVTFAEPAIGALQAAGSMVDVEQAPYLHALLTTYSLRLVLLVGLGVGVAAVLGTIRFLKGWSLKPLIYAVLGPTLLLTLVFASHEQLQKILGLAWDCGAVTTGPVTVPLVLSLGIGIAQSAGKGGGSLSGFGVVTLASLFPVLAVQGLAIHLALTTSPDVIIEAARAAGAAATTPAWHEQTPWVEVVLGVRAIVPLVLFLLFVLFVVLRDRLREPLNIAFGIFLCVLGMCVFNIGLTHGLAKLGGQSGSLVPGSFTEVASVEGSPLYAVVFGLLIAIGFAWVLGVGATLAEPALNALGQTVENLTSGAFRKTTLMRAVALGVGCGIAAGVAKIIFDLPVWWLLVPAYGLAVLLTALSTEEFVNIAWDSAGVTTGPVTVPLVLAMGLGLGNAVNAVEGFGILSMASIGPILAVLATGLWTQYRVKRRHDRTQASAQADAPSVSTTAIVSSGEAE